MPLRSQNRCAQAHCSRDQAAACVQCTRYMDAYALTRAQKATAMLTIISSGRSWEMRLMDASDSLRALDGWTGGRVLSFNRAATARPTVNQGAGRPRGVLEAWAAAIGRSGSANCHIRAHYQRREPRFACDGRLIDAGRPVECL